jgi:hypothetical protein
LEGSFGGNNGILSMFGLSGGNPSVSSGTDLGAGTGGLAFPMFADGTDNAPGGWSVVGEQGPELVNLNPGSQVLPNGVTPAGGASSGPPNLNVNVVNNTGTQASTTTSTAANGDVTVTLNKAVDTAVGNSITSGAGMRVLASQYGVKPFTGM